MNADVPDTRRVEPFGLLCAPPTTANAEIGRGPPERLIVGGPDATSVWRTAGPTPVLVAVLPTGEELTRVCERGRAVADRLCGGSSLA